MEEEKIKEIDSKEPVRPHRPNFIYEDATLKSLMEGLSEQPEACIISDEAITFFKGLLKNNPGLLNKSWDGESYDLVRARGEKYTAKPCLTISLMSQSGIFTDYISKHSSTARESGFLSRFLFSQVTSSIGKRNNEYKNLHWEDKLKIFHDRVNELLIEVKFNIHSLNGKKKTLKLESDAISLWKNYNIKVNDKIKSGGEWWYIRDFGAKAGANVLRIAAILHHFYTSKSNEIHKNTIELTCELMNWYMSQTSNLFFPYSERYHFEMDVRELYFWIKNRTEKNNALAFPKNDIQKYGPNRLRRLDKLKPVLDQLISQGLINVIQVNPNGLFYISTLYPNGLYAFPPNYHSASQIMIIQSHSNTRGKNPPVDLTNV